MRLLDLLMANPRGKTCPPSPPPTDPITCKAVLPTRSVASDGWPEECLVDGIAPGTICKDLCSYDGEAHDVAVCNAEGEWEHPCHQISCECCLCELSVHARVCNSCSWRCCKAQLHPIQYPQCCYTLASSIPWSAVACPASLTNRQHVCAFQRLPQLIPLLPLVCHLHVSVRFFLAREQVDVTTVFTSPHRL
jgi:hypothetical protein